MREIVLDTETTGLDPLTGDRIVEIGAVELLNHIPKGSRFHVYLNPERDVPAEAQAVHGLTREFLSDKPLFRDVADDFLAFIGDAQLVIHNASFDLAFLNAELTRIGRAPIPTHRTTDSLDLARRRHPGASNTLDALCQRYGIDNSRRDLHGALLDAELLAEVYVELLGGRQSALALGIETEIVVEVAVASAPRVRPAPLAPRVDAQDVARHRAFVRGLGPAPLWAEYDPKIAVAAPGDG